MKFDPRMKKHDMAARLDKMALVPQLGPRGIHSATPKSGGRRADIIKRLDLKVDD